MKRILSLSLIAAVSLGVYVTRDSQASVRSQDLSASLRSCSIKTGGAAAVAACDKVLALDGLADSTRGELSWRKAYVLRNMGEKDAAIRVYSQSIEYGSKFQRSALNNRAVLYQEVGNVEAMAADNERIIADWPEVRDRNYFGAIRMLRGRARDAGDTARADALALLYLEGIPQDRRTLLRRIKHLEKFAKNYPQPELTLTQLADLTRAIAYDPEDYDRYEARMEVLQKLGLVEPAMRDGVRWFEIISRSPEVEQDMTPAEREEMGLVADAIFATFDEIKSKSKLGVATEATDRVSYAERAYWRYAQGDIAGALADYKAARAIPSQSDAWSDADLDEVIDFYPRLLAVTRGTDLEF